MFSRITSLSLFAISALPLLAAASAVPRGGPIGPSQCNTGDIKCCNSVEAANSPNVVKQAGLLGVVLGPINALVGLTCSPISVIALQNNGCTAQPACCTGTQFNGLINLGCTPINVGL